MARLLAGLLASHVVGATAQLQPEENSTQIGPFHDNGLLRIQAFGRYAKSPASGLVFDAPAFEIAFSVTGASRVEIVLKQAYSAPPSAEGPVFEAEEGRPAVRGGHLAEGLAECVDTGNHQQTFTVFVDGEAQRPLNGSSCVFCTFDTGMFPYDSDYPLNPYPVATGLDPSSSQEIRIVKDSEADFNNCETTYANYVTISHLNLFFQGGDGEGAIPQVALPRTASYARKKIEFIGDSTMTGMCNLCHVDNFAGDPRNVFRSSARLSWPKQMCDKLDADCRMTTWSGLELNSSENQLDLWRRQVMTNASSLREEAWKADVVIVGLSVDDDSNGDGNFWEDVENKLLSFTVEVQAAYNYNTVVMLVCLPTFPTSGDVFCGRARRAATRAQKHNPPVWHATVWDAHGHLTPDNQCCGKPDKDAAGLLADAAISACNAERPNSCVRSSAPPGPPAPEVDKPWYKANPPLVSFLFVGIGVALLCICALSVGGVPEAPCKKKVDPEAGNAPLAAGR